MNKMKIMAACAIVAVAGIASAAPKTVDVDAGDLARRHHHRTWCQPPPPPPPPCWWTQPPPPPPPPHHHHHHRRGRCWR
ncbi:MAG: hypothetical protein K6F50_03080 [Kiritimatiellae bacterium]|nr:hypothetical protein [Kiritimatiellia bacterium]